jgi:group I intron endonuclease
MVYRGVIYKATCKATGKCYIGQTHRDVESRWQEHLYLATNTKKKSKFYNAIKKFGTVSIEWEVLEDNISTPEELNLKEQYYILKYDSYQNGYNSTTGGGGFRSK